MDDSFLFLLLFIRFILHPRKNSLIIFLPMMNKFIEQNAKNISLIFFNYEKFWLFGILWLITLCLFLSFSIFFVYSSHLQHELDIDERYSNCTGNLINFIHFLFYFCFYICVYLKHPNHGDMIVLLTSRITWEFDEYSETKEFFHVDIRYWYA